MSLSIGQFKLLSSIFVCCSRDIVGESDGSTGNTELGREEKGWGIER